MPGPSDPGFDTLALHALMFFLADLDSGRIGDRLEESFEED